MNTIVEITYTNYTENIIVNLNNVKQVSKFVKNLKWDYFIVGDVLVENSTDRVSKNNANKYLKLYLELDVLGTRIENETMMNFERKKLSKQINKLENTLNTIAPKINISEFNDVLQDTLCMGYREFRNIYNGAFL